MLDLLKTFQQELIAMRQQITTLDVKVNKEMPAQLDQAFKEIQQNFLAITKGFEAINARTTTTGTVAAAAQTPQGSGFQGIVENIAKAIGKAIEGGSSGSAGALSDFDKEILKTSKAIQLLTLKDTLKRVAKSAGVELAEHIVVSP
jgi:hypothetical protein